jgi:hypothetical protein
MKISEVIDNFRQYKTTRKISMGFFVLTLFSVQIVSVLSIIGVVSVPEILANIKIPAGYVYTNIDIDYPEDMIVSMPYDISNEGIYDLTEIIVNTEIYIVYVNQSNSLNITKNIFSKIQMLPDCKAQQRSIGIFEGRFSDFNISSLIIFFDEADQFAKVEFFLNLKVSSNYFYNLIRMKIGYLNLNLSEF